MKHQWNWQQSDWPHFTYSPGVIAQQEQAFLLHTAHVSGVMKHLGIEDKAEFLVQLMADEAFHTSEIEGEHLHYGSLQASIRRNFGLDAPRSAQYPREEGIAEMMFDCYQHYARPLTHDTLWEWHVMLLSGRRDVHCIGQYRYHEEPMQVVSGYPSRITVHFEAPPSHVMMSEMTAFIDWFNHTAPALLHSGSALLRAAIAHLYFVCIHPFEDGNGRIGRALVEKVLAQHAQHPSLLALSKVIQANKTGYYDALEQQNKHNQIDEWLIYFAEVILAAQQETANLLEWILLKTRFFQRYQSTLNARQLKVLTKLLAKGPEGFEGGLSAKNYMAIAKTSASTATRDLADLVNQQILQKTGQLKAARYSINDHFFND